MFHIFLTILFCVLGLFFFYLFFFKKPKLHPLKFFLGLWFCVIGISQLLLSDFEKPWTFYFWILIFSSLACFALGAFVGDILRRKRKPKPTPKVSFRGAKRRGISQLVWGELRLKLAILVLVALSILANIYIYLKIGTLPLFSSDPDNLRFIINRHIFGLWEYLALAARIFIPLACIYLFLQRKVSKKDWIFSILVMVFGLATLIIYMSRITIFFPVLLSYFAYLLLNIKSLTFKKIILSTLIALIFLGSFMIAIPKIRQTISYRGVYKAIAIQFMEEEEIAGRTSETYLFDISKLHIPEKLSFLAFPYTSTSFNLQTLQNATQYYPQKHSFYLGKASFWFLYPLTKLNFFNIDIPWKEFAPASWWNTATYLFPFWTDFGMAGIILGCLIWGLVASAAYWWARKRRTVLSLLGFGLLGFVLFFSFYTNYMARSEFWLDVVLIIAIGYFVNSKFKKL